MRENVLREKIRMKSKSGRRVNIDKRMLQGRDLVAYEK
jgi:ribosomal protein L34